MRFLRPGWSRSQGQIWWNWRLKSFWTLIITKVIFTRYKNWSEFLAKYLTCPWFSHAKYIKKSFILRVCSSSTPHMMVCSFFGTFLRMRMIFAKNVCNYFQLLLFLAKFKEWMEFPFLCNKTVIVLTLLYVCLFFRKKLHLKSISFLFLNHITRFKKCSRRKNKEKRKTSSCVCGSFKKVFTPCSIVRHAFLSFLMSLFNTLWHCLLCTTMGRRCFEKMNKCCL